MAIMFGLTLIAIFLLAIYLQIASMGKVDLSFLLGSFISSFILAAIIFVVVATQLTILKFLFDIFYSM